jgi:AcrR family transcriptional regulator
MGLRERKKERTRIALIDAALDLFLAQGYEATTIDQIAAAVDVSPRTFFRYFASKEDVALSLPRDGQEIFLSELAARSDDEPPHQALSQAMRSMLDIVREGDAAEATRFLKARELVDRNPVLFGGQMRLMMDNERKLVAEVARRQGTDVCDLRPQFVVSLFTAIARVCFEHGPHDLDLLAQRLEDILALADRSLRPGWDR